MHRAMTRMPCHHACHMDHSGSFSLLSWTCIHTDELLSLFRPHMGAIDAFKELVTGCWSGYKLLVGPLDDVACFTIINLRSTHLEEATRATCTRSLTWTNHTCGSDVMLLRWLFHIWTIPHIVGVGWRHIGGPWTMFDSSFHSLMGHRLYF
jgi:hypothetical protein